MSNKNNKQANKPKILENEQSAYEENKNEVIAQTEDTKAKTSTKTSNKNKVVEVKGKDVNQ